MPEGFTTAAPIPEDVIERYAGAVPAGVVELWRTHGTGWFDGGFFRLVDPAHAEARLHSRREPRARGDVKHRGG